MSLTGDRLRQAHSVLGDTPNPGSGLRLGGIDHLEFWVGNARQAAGFFAAAFGFDIVAYAGPETGLADRAWYVLSQGDIRFVVTAGLSPDSPVTAHARAHGDGVRDLAFVVDNAALAYETALARGATGLRAPWVESDADGRIVRATVATYGDTRAHLRGARPLHRPLRSRLPGLPADPARGSPGRSHPGRPRGGQRRARRVWRPGSTTTRRSSASTSSSISTTRPISTEYSALMSTVVWDGSKVVLPINEPATGLPPQPDPGVPRLLRRSRGPAHRPAHLRHRHHLRACTTAGCASWGTGRLLRGGGRAHDRDRPPLGRPRRPRHPGRPGPRGPSPPGLHRDRRGPAHGVLRDHPAGRVPRLRRRELQGPVRGNRARAGPGATCNGRRRRRNFGRRRHIARFRSSTPRNSPPCRTRAAGSDLARTPWGEGGGTAFVTRPGPAPRRPTLCF